MGLRNSTDSIWFLSRNMQPLDIATRFLIETARQHDWNAYEGDIARNSHMGRHKQERIINDTFSND